MNDNNGIQGETTTAKTAAGCLGCIDWRKIALRAKDVLANPRGIWEEVKREDDGFSPFIKQYALVLAAVPVVCQFLRMTFIGMKVPFVNVTFRWPFFSGLVYSVAEYVLLLLGIFVTAMAVEMLAPRFNAAISRGDSIKLVVYSMTPGLVGGFFHLIPGLLPLLVLLSLYGLYVFYQGFMHMTAVSEDQKWKYLAAVIVSAGVIMLIIRGLAGTLQPDMPEPNEISFGNVTVNTEQLQKGLEQVEKNLEQLQKAIPTPPQ